MSEHNLSTPEQLEHFSAVKQFYQERGVTKTDAEVSKTVHKFSSPVWTNPATGEEESTGGYDNMWVILRNKYAPGTATQHTQVIQPGQQVIHVAQGSRQIPTHVAVCTSPTSPTHSVQVGNSSLASHSVTHQAISTRSVPHQAASPVQYTAAPVQMASHSVTHQAISARSVPHQAASPVQYISQPYPVPQQTYSPMSSQRMENTLGRLPQERTLTEETTMTTTKTRTLSPDVLRRAREKSQGKRSDLKGVGHYSEDNINSTVRQLALNDQNGPRGHINPAASTSSSTKPASKYYKLVPSAGNKGPGGATIQSSNTFKAHHLAENEASGLTSLGASKRAAPAGACGGGMSASQKSQLGGVRIPTGPSIIRAELAKEDVVLNEFRGLDNHRYSEREVTGTFKTGEWLGRGR